MDARRTTFRLVVNELIFVASLASIAYALQQLALTPSYAFMDLAW